MGSWDTGTSALPHSVVYFFDVCRIIPQHTSQHTSAYGFLRQCHVCLASCCCICILVLSYIRVLILCVLIQADPALLVSRDRYSVYLLYWYKSTNTDAGAFSGQWHGCRTSRTRLCSHSTSRLGGGGVVKLVVKLGVKLVVKLVVKLSPDSCRHALLPVHDYAYDYA